VTRPFSYLSPKVKIRPSVIKGQGAFAIRAIRKDEIISISGGHILAEKEYLRLFQTKPHFKDYAMKVAPGFYLVPLAQADLDHDDYFNHSCAPNAGMRGQIVLVAMRHIRAGEEITYDYAMTDDDPDDYLQCHCGSRACRGVIRGSDWKKPQLQKKYRGYFALHVQEKIERFKKKSHVNSR